MSTNKPKKARRAKRKARSHITLDDLYLAQMRANLGVLERVNDELRKRNR